MNKTIIVLISILFLFVENLSAYSLEILNTDVTYFYESTKSIPMFVIILGVIAFIYFIFSFFNLEHLITAISILIGVFIIYTVIRYEEESKHIFDINQKVYYRLIAEDKNPKNYIKFQDINSVKFREYVVSNHRGSGYPVYGLYLYLKNGQVYDLYSSRRDKEIIQMQGKLIAKYIEKSYKE